jgi:hypothetical protein
MSPLRYIGYALLAGAVVWAWGILAVFTVWSIGR